MIVAMLVISMTVTGYVPMAGKQFPINGTACAHVAWDKCPYPLGTVACGPSWPFGTKFEMPKRLGLYGVPRVVECNSRGGDVGDHQLDVSLIHGPWWRIDLALARLLGKRLVDVIVIRPTERDWFSMPNAYQQ